MTRIDPGDAAAILARLRAAGVPQDDAAPYAALRGAARSRSPHTQPQRHTMVVLGMDMSSTCIGYATADGKRYGAHTLEGDIAARCASAVCRTQELLDWLRPALVVIESPVARFAKAVIPQARVSGAVLAVLSTRQALWVEVAPTAAKRALCDDGGATKAEMVEEAARRLGLPGAAAVLRSKAVWRNGSAVLLSEDEADAYALALAGLAMKIVEVAP